MTQLVDAPVAPAATPLSLVADAATRRRTHLATVMWVSLVLSVGLARALPVLPGAAELVVRAVGVLTAAAVIAVRPRDLPAAERVPTPLLLSFVAVPALGALLALTRVEPGDAVNHLASVLSLLAAASLGRAVLAESLRRALLVLVGGSLLLGLVYSASVAPSGRAFLRPLYDGRLVGLLGSANVLGTVSVLLVVVSLLSFHGRRRTVGVGVALLGLLATSSQTSLGVAVLVLGSYAALSLRRRGRGPELVVLAALGLSAVLLAVGTWLQLNAARDLGELASRVTFSYRTDVWEVALRQDVPFLGIGQSAIQSLFETTVIQGAIGISSVHNGLIDGYLRDGWPGLVVLLVLLVTIVVTAVRRRAWLVLLPATVLVVVGAFEVFPTHVPYFALIFAGILLAMPAERPAPTAAS